MQKPIQCDVPGCRVPTSYGQMAAITVEGEPAEPPRHLCEAHRPRARGEMGEIAPDFTPLLGQINYFRDFLHPSRCVRVDLPPTGRECGAVPDYPLDCHCAACQRGPADRVAASASVDGTRVAFLCSAERFGTGRSGDGPLIDFFDVVTQAFPDEPLRFEIAPDPMHTNRASAALGW